MPIILEQPATPMLRPGDPPWGLGVATATELRLFPITEVYAGLLWWPIHAAAGVLQVWRELTQTGVPEGFTTSVRLLRFPALPHIAEPVRGRWFVVADVVHLRSPAEADEILRPLRALGPVRDTVTTMLSQDLGQLQMEPEQPVPTVGDELMLASLPPEAVTALLRVAGPDTLSLLTAVELRHAGGEMRCARLDNGVLAVIEGQYVLSAAGRAPTPAAAASVASGLEGVISAMRPWAARQMYLNLAGTTRDPAIIWSATADARLHRTTAAVGPGNLIGSNHPVPSPPPDTQPPAP
jgi:hypothetical protein